MSKLATLVGFLLALAWAQSREIIPKYGIKSGSPIYLKVDSETGEQYNLSCQNQVIKPFKSFIRDKSVLHPNIKVITVGTDAETGHNTYDYWTPSKNELNEAEDVYVDEKNLAAVRVNYENRERSMIGVVNGKRLEAKNGEAKLYERLQQNHSDYIDLGIKLTHSLVMQSSPNAARMMLFAEYWWFATRVWRHFSTRPDTEWAPSLKRRELQMDEPNSEESRSFKYWLSTN
ncbi:hypothetical protein Ocin01_18683, partial [Orchesella cincta]